MGDPPTRKTKMRNKLKKNEGKMGEIVRKREKIEDILLCGLPGRETGYGPAMSHMQIR